MALGGTNVGVAGDARSGPGLLGQQRANIENNNSRLQDLVRRLSTIGEHILGSEVVDIRKAPAGAPVPAPSGVGHQIVDAVAFQNTILDDLERRVSQLEVL